MIIDYNMSSINTFGKLAASIWLRINQDVDTSAGLSLSEKMTIQIGEGVNWFDYFA